MNAIGRSTALLTLGTGTGQVFSLLRSLFIAAAVGISSSFDAILVAMVIPTVLSIFLSGSVRVALVPTYLGIAHRSGEPDARRFLGGLLTWVAIAAVAAALVVAAFPGPSVSISGPGLAPEARLLAAGYVPILAPMLAFMAMTNLLVGVCQIGRSFLPIAISTTLGPLAALVVTAGLWGRLGITAYALGTTVGTAVSLVTLAVGAIRQGLLPSPSLRLDRRELSSFARHVLPMTAGSAFLQLNLISDRAIATLLSAGAASALKYGQQIVSEPAAAFSASWATVVYPAVVVSGGLSSSTTMGAAMTTATRYTLAVFMPLTVATVALAPLVVGVVYGRGAFDREAIRTTVTVAVAFAPMLLLTMIQPVLVAAHNARRRGMLMGLTAVSNAALNVVLNLAFGSVLGVAGIALSSSVTLAVLLLFLAWRVPTDEGFRMREVADAAGRALAASLVPGIPIGALVWWLTRDGIVAGGLPILIVCAITGAVGYLLATRLFRLPEPWIMFGALGDALKRRFAAGRLR